MTTYFQWAADRERHAPWVPGVAHRAAQINYWEPPPARRLPQPQGAWFYDTREPRKPGVYVPLVPERAIPLMVDHEVTGKVFLSDRVTVHTPPFTFPTDCGY